MIKNTFVISDILGYLSLLFVTAAVDLAVFIWFMIIEGLIKGGEKQEK